MKINFCQIKSSFPAILVFEVIFRWAPPLYEPLYVCVCVRLSQIRILFRRFILPLPQVTSTPGHWNNRTQGHQDKRTQGHKDIKLQGHWDTGTPGHWDFGTLGHCTAGQHEKQSVKKGIFTKTAVTYQIFTVLGSLMTVLINFWQNSDKIFLNAPLSSTMGQVRAFQRLTS